MRLSDLTLGIEEEYQIIDPETRALEPANAVLIERGRERGEDLKPELMQSQIEVGTKVCGNIREARQEIVRLRRTVCDLAAAQDLHMAAASTHPFSRWNEQLVSAGERYTKLQDDLRDVAKRLLIFGMHVHVGIPDEEIRIDIMNQMRYFMPHLLALSTSSPFWHGRETGLKSYRSVIFENMPRSGLPPSFRSWADYNAFVGTLIETGCIDEPTKIWWDIRPHPSFPTVEFRIADICTRVDEVLCIAALMQALVAKLIKLRRNNRTWRQYRHHLITENKWRAVRYGIDGQLIDFGQTREVPVRLLVREILELVDDVIDELGSRPEVEYVNVILDQGSSADRQLATYRETDSLEAVVDRIVAETKEGLESDPR